jgi:hypothetical protein
MTLSILINISFYLVAITAAGIVIGASMVSRSKSVAKNLSILILIPIGFAASLIIGLLAGGVSPELNCDDAWDRTCATGWLWYGSKVFAVSGLLAGTWQSLFLRQHVKSGILLPVLGLAGGLVGGATFGWLQDSLIRTMMFGSTKWTELVLCGHILFVPLIAIIMSTYQFIGLRGLNRSSKEQIHGIS